MIEVTLQIGDRTITVAVDEEDWNAISHMYLDTVEISPYEQIIRIS